MSETTTIPEETEAENTTATQDAEVSLNGTTSFHIIDQIIKGDKHLSYGERVILKAVQSVGLDILTAIQLYSGETTEDPETGGNDGVQDGSD